MVDAKDLEFVAKKVHEEWMSGRIKDGWTYGEERDDKAKRTPCLVPYENLSEIEKEYDRRTSMRVMEALKELGYKIQKETMQ